MIFYCFDVVILADFVVFFEIWFGDDAFSVVCESWIGFVYVDFVFVLIFVLSDVLVITDMKVLIDIDFEDSCDSRFLVVV